LAFRAFHIILLFAVFFSTTGVTVSRHYCRNEFKHFALFVEPSDCHGQEKQACGSGGHCSMLATSQEENNCCNNEAEYFKLDQEKQVPAEGLEPVKIPGPAAMIHPVLYAGFTNGYTPSSAYLLFKPPIVCDDFQSMLQTFLL